MARLPVAGSPRERIDFNSGWRFRRGDAPDAGTSLDYESSAGGYVDIGCTGGFCEYAAACETATDRCTSGIESLGFACGEDYPYLYSCSAGA
jgi:hypothetical protein